MKILVAYYSKTGNTKRVALEIAKALKAEVEEIVDLTKRSGIIEWFKAGRDEMKGYLTEIVTTKNPGDYDLVIIGTPVWAWGSTPATRAYVAKYKDKLKKVAVFSTSGDTLPEKPKQVLEKILEKKVLAYTGWTTADIKNERVYQQKINDFVKAIEILPRELKK